ncbi:MAG: sugar phosphate isomerase/epimerase [Balneolaceae bacterium]|nr:MAG: sugar phosphate isomerase/epimerase [Balneolaceae bacterium]
MYYKIISVITFLICLSIIHPKPQALLAQQGEQLLPDPGVVSYTFRNQFQEDFTGTLDMIKEMGIMNIEFSNLFGHTAVEIRQMLDQRGMFCTSYGVGYDALVNHTELAAEDALTLGASFVRVAWIPHDGEFSIEHTRRAIRDFTEAGKILRDYGLRFAYHNHGYEFRPYEGGTLFDYMVQNSDPEYVNFQMDTFWVAQPGHDPVKLLKKYPDRFLLVHLKDLANDAESNFSGSAPSEYDVPLGTGQIDFEAFLRAAQNSAIEHFYIEDETEDVVTRVPQSREFLLGITR